MPQPEPTPPASPTRPSDATTTRSPAHAALFGVDCVKVGIAGDDRVRVASGRERDQVVVVGVAAHGGGRPRRIGEQDGLGGEVGDESQRLIW
jgi:hypothetical protein